MNDLLVLVIAFLVIGTAAKAAHVTYSRPTKDGIDDWK